MFLCKKCRYIDFQHDKGNCIRLKGVKAPQGTERKIEEDTDSEDESFEDEHNTEARVEDDNSYHSAEEDMEYVTEDDIENQNDNISDNEEETELSDDDNVDPNFRDPTTSIKADDDSIKEKESLTEKEREVAPQFRDMPTYIKPKKGDKIEYFKAETDSWIKAKVETHLPRYRDWFNIQNEDSTRCSVQLSKDTLWRYEKEEDNGYYFWRWERNYQEDCRDGERKEDGD